MLLLVVAAVLGVAAAIWLLLLSLLLGWPGFAGMLLLLVGIGITVVRMNRSIAQRALPKHAESGAAGVAMMVVGVVGLLVGAVGRIF